MKKTYMQPQTAVTTVELQSAMLVASNPNITVNPGGGAAPGSFETKGRGEWDIWGNGN